MISEKIFEIRLQLAKTLMLFEKNNNKQEAFVLLTDALEKLSHYLSFLKLVIFNGEVSKRAEEVADLKKLKNFIEELISTKVGEISWLHHTTLVALQNKDFVNVFVDEEELNETIFESVKGLTLSERWIKETEIMAN